VAVFNVGGRVFAVENSCPHQGGPLCKGRVSGARLPTAPYENRYDGERPILTCPWHGWEFELESGKALFDPAIHVPCFDVRIDGDQVVLAARRPA
jgi:nitrite reductase (NADH) small subunit